MTKYQMFLWGAWLKCGGQSMVKETRFFFTKDRGDNQEYGYDKKHANSMK